MKVFHIVILAQLGQSWATSAAKRQQPSAVEVAILQLGLGIKQLSVAFYQDGLSQFSPGDFVKSGNSVAYYNNLLDIQFDEQFHVTLLTHALEEIGAKPNQPCNFTFPFRNVREFIALASLIEGIITDGFIGISSQIQTPELNRNAEAILAVDGMHTAIQRGEAGRVILANSRKQPVTPNQLTTLLTPFIVSCPLSNMSNSSRAFPPLHATATRPLKQLSLLPLSIPDGELPSSFFVTFISGANVKTDLPTDINGRTFKVPVGSNMAGQTYVVVTNLNSNSTLDDSNILFGPTVIEVEPLPRNISAFDGGI